MMSVNSLLSPASEASDTVPTVAIFLPRSHGYVWHAEVEVPLSFTYTAHCKSLQLSTSSHQPELSEMQYSYIASTWPHYVTCLIQHSDINSEKPDFVSSPICLQKLPLISGNVVGHSMNVHLLSYTVHVALWNIYTDHKRGGNHVTLLFEQLQSLVGELESAVQGEAILDSNETVSTWAYRKWEGGCVKIIRESVAQSTRKLFCGELPGCSEGKLQGCYGSEWMWTDVEWAGAVWLLLNSTALQMKSQDK